MTYHIDISIGPVQGFVAQSRRTRDLWGSSYLLSFLAGHAIHSAIQAGGKVVHPRVENDPLLLQIQGKSIQPPSAVGSLPNRFVVAVDQNPAAVGKAAQKGFQRAWEKVADAVWQKFVAPVMSHGRDTREIWKRQVESFWELVWIVSEGRSPGALAQRKHWRSHWLPEEPGDKCTVMPDFQELSGWIRARGSKEREAQDTFWGHVRRGLGHLDLRDNERLSSIALIKRLFPKLSEEALGWPLHAAHWPSTVYIAAVPWIRRVANQIPDAAAEYARQLRQHAPPAVLAERNPPFRDLDVHQAGDFPRLDGNYLHPTTLANEKVTPLREGVAEQERQALQKVLKETICEKIPEGASRKLGAPPSFYALLLADGDRLGKLVSDLGGDKVSEALSRFTKEVSPIVASCDGVTVYAGGDDVLAMLPASGALECADRIQRAYQQAFSSIRAEAGATLSAAVVLAHIRSPLSAILREAHRLLDHVAKDQNGRSSLAVAVYKTGGLHCQWVTTWQRPGLQSPESAVGMLQELQRSLTRGGSEAGLSQSLLYRLRETLGLLCGWKPRWQPGDWGSLSEDLDAERFLYAEIVRTLPDPSEEGGEGRQELARRIAGLVWRLLPEARNTRSQSPPGPVRVGFDAILLASFMAGDGQEGELA